VDELPAAQNVQIPGFSYHSEPKLDGDLLIYRRVYERKSADFPVDELGKLKDFFRRISSDERAMTILKRSAAEPKPAAQASKRSPR